MLNGSFLLTMMALSLNPKTMKGRPVERATDSRTPGRGTVDFSV